MNSPKQYLLQLNIMYGAQAMVVIVFSGIAMAMRNQENIDHELTQLLLYVLAGILIITLTGAHFIFRKIVVGIDATLPLPAKLQKFLLAAIVRTALIEIPAFLACIITIVTGSLLPFGVVGVILVLFVILRPTTTLITQELHLTNEERLALSR